MSKESKIAMLLLASLAGWGGFVFLGSADDGRPVAELSSEAEENSWGPISARAPRSFGRAKTGSAGRRSTAPVLRPPRIERPRPVKPAAPAEPPALVDVVRPKANDDPPADEVTPAGDANIDDRYSRLDSPSDVELAEPPLPLRADLEPADGSLVAQPFPPLREDELPTEFPADEPLQPVAMDEADRSANPETGASGDEVRDDPPLLADDEPAAAADDADYDRLPDEFPAAAAAVPRAAPLKAVPSKAKIRSRPAPKARPGNTAPPAEGDEFLVHIGDEFWTISQRLFGTGGYSQAIEQHNRTRLAADGKLLGGEILIIPSAVELRRLYPTLCPQVGSAEEDDVADASQLASRPRARVMRRTYTVSEGETLFSIARSELGRADRWVEIYQLNQAEIGDNVDYVAPGLVLTLPNEFAADQTTGRPGFYRRR